MSSQKMSKCQKDRANTKRLVAWSHLHLHSIRPDSLVQSVQSCYRKRPKDRFDKLQTAQHWKTLTSIENVFKHAIEVAPEALLKVPMAHGEGAETPAGQKEPAGQTTNVAGPVPTGQYRPATQTNCEELDDPDPLKQNKNQNETDNVCITPTKKTKLSNCHKC